MKKNNIYDCLVQNPCFILSTHESDFDWRADLDAQTLTPLSKNLSLISKIHHDSKLFARNFLFNIIVYGDFCHLEYARERIKQFPNLLDLVKGLELNIFCTENSNFSGQRKRPRRLVLITMI